MDYMDDEPVVVEVEEDTIDREERVQAARRASIVLWTENLDVASTAYELQTTGHADAFCSVTISWYNPFLRYFQSVSCLFTAICLFLSPYQYFFRTREVIFHLNTVADMIYLLVILFRSRTSHMIDGVEERNLLKVRKRYQTSFAFILDLITYFPLAQLRWPFTDYDEVFYSLNRQTILIRLHYILFYLEIREKESGSSTLLYRTTKYLLLSLLTMHFAACGWYGLACSHSDSNKPFSLDICSESSWINFLPQYIIEKVLSASDDTDLTGPAESVSFLHNTYITSLYWSAATVTSTGYGDVHAYSIQEKIYSVFAMLIGMAVLYGLTMGGMTSMLTNIDAQRSRFVHRYQAFEKEVNRMGVSDQVKELCLNYFDYTWRRWEGEDVFSTGFLNKLPDTLKSSFAEARFRNFLQKADLLQDTEEAFLRNLSMACKPMVYLENQYIQKSGEICDSMCYIHHGLVEVLDADEKEVVAVMQRGKLFGQSLLVYDLPRINSIRCRTNCDIFMLNKEDFRNILAEYPESARKFLNAIQHKCGSRHRGGWPMAAVTSLDLARQSGGQDEVRHQLHAFSVSRDSELGLKPTTSYLNTRRRTTVHSTDYSGLDLMRVPLQPKSSDKSRDIKRLSEVKPSLVEFVKRKEKPKQRRSSTVLKDGTAMIARGSSYKNLKEAVGPGADYEDPDKISFRNRLFQLTIINPKGLFYNFWLNYLFVMSLIAGLYTTFIAFFTTTPGQQTPYIPTGDDDLFGKEILYMATDSCNVTQNNLYYECPPWPFNETAICLRETGGSFAWRILEAETGKFRVILPARYNITRAAYSLTTDESQAHFVISYLVIDLSFYLNILINFRTEVLTPNGFLTSFKDIAVNYMKPSKLLLDILGVIPLEALSRFFGCSRIVYYHIWAFLRLNRVLFFFRYVPTTFSRWEYSLNVKIARIRTLKFLVYIYSFTHICACLFYWWSCGYVTQRDVENIQYKCSFGSWAWVFDISYLTGHWEDYIKTMYWASTTMTSTGYGDISASTTIGRIFALSTMIVGTVMYGWLVAVIASTVSNSEAAAVEFTNSMLDMKNYLAVHLVPDALINKVMNVRRIEWERYAGTAIPGKEAVGRELSSLLHSVLLYESLNAYVECLPFFNGVDPAFIAMLCNHVFIYHYSEGDIVIYEGDLSRNLYIIKKGHCNVVTEDLETKIDHLCPGDYFGECEVLFGCGSPRTVVAETACELIVLRRDDIDAILEAFPLVSQQMHTIQKDLSYKLRVLGVIKRRNRIAAQKEKNSMSVLYKVKYVEGTVKMYTERRKETSVFIFLKKSDRNISLSFITTFFSCFLMPFALDPLSRSYIIYESVRAFLILLTVLLVPVEFAFLPSSKKLMLLQYTLDALCLLDQYVKAHTCYFNARAILVTHPVRTSVHYLRTSFTVDLLSWFPFEILLYFRIRNPREELAELQVRLLALLRVTRLLQLYKLHGFFSFWLSGIRELNRWIRHFRSLLYGILLHHWFACLMFVAACPPDYNDKSKIYDTESSVVTLTATGYSTFCENNTWIGQTISQNTFPALDIVGSIADQYVVSIYWATATLVCVGYGDIHAYVPPEMFLATIVMICGTVFYSYILGGMSASVQTDDMKRGHYKGKLSDIVKFFNVYDVSEATQKQVLNYYYYLWDRTGGVSPEKLFIGLPPSIRTSVCQSMYGPMIREAFDEVDSIDQDTQGFFRLLSTYIAPSLYLKGSVICRRHDIGNEMFFIQRGSVAIIDDDEVTTCKVLGPGQHFGEVALLFAIPRSKTVKAITNCELNVLTKKDLDHILDMFPEYRDRMTAIAHDRRLKGAQSATYEHQMSELAVINLGSQTSQSEKHAAEPPPKQSMFRLRVVARESQLVMIANNVTVILAFLSSSLSIYQACFFSHYIGLYIIGYLMDVWFLADMLLTYQTSFLDQFSTIVEDLGRINVHYAKSRDLFFISAFSSAPFEVLGLFLPFGAHTRFLVFSFARLNRVLRMHRLTQVFHDWSKDIRKDVLIVRLYESLLIVVFVINAMACLWFAIACPNGECGDKTWTTKEFTAYDDQGIESYNALPWVDSVYWTVATLTSTGYGDIKPEIQIEMLYACVVMVLGKLMIGYVLGMAAATLANDESLRVWYKHSVSAVKKCMADHKFDKKLQGHVVQYYEYMWMKNQGVNIDDLFPDLSFSLRADIYSQICGHIVHSMELFQSCPENFLRHVCMHMVPTSFMPGDYICYEGDVRAEMFSIYRGIAEAVKKVDAKDITIRLVLEGENFLCESILCKVRRPCSLRAQTYVDVFSLTMENLQTVLKYHPDVNFIILENAKKVYPHLKL